MCLDPVTAGWIFAGLAAVGTATEIQTQNQYANAEAEAAKEAYKADYASLIQQRLEVDNQALLEKFDRTNQGFLERSHLKTQITESGAIGNSSLREIMTSQGDESYDLGIIAYNQKNRLDQNTNDIQSTYSTYKSRMNQANSRITNKKNAALKIGAAGLQGFAQGYAMGAGGV
jgi:hypothetical protein